MQNLHKITHEIKKIQDYSWYLLSWHTLAGKGEIRKLSKNDFVLIFGVVFGIFAAGAVGIFILISESPDNIDIVGFNSTNR